MAKVSVLIPSRNEEFLNRTVSDVFDKAGGEIEVIVNVDESKPGEVIEDKRVVYLYPKAPRGMRAGINDCAAIAKGEYLMKLDAHCILDQDFDTKLKADCEDNWVVIPRRYRLDSKQWVVEPVTPGRLQIDYEHFIYPRKYRPVSLHGYRWDTRTAARKDILLDDNMTFQGSCWFMTRKHFDRCKFLQIQGYNGLPQQEAEEIGLTTWISGGRVVTNKKVWYAHFFKGKEHGFGYRIDRGQARDCYQYSYQHWVLDQREGFTKVIEKFWPVPDWPENWQERIYK